MSSFRFEANRQAQPIHDPVKSEKIISKGNRTDRLCLSNNDQINERYSFAATIIQSKSPDKTPWIFNKNRFVLVLDEPSHTWYKVNKNSLAKRLGVEKTEINAMSKSEEKGYISTQAILEKIGNTDESTVDDTSTPDAIPVEDLSVDENLPRIGVDSTVTEKKFNTPSNLLPSTESVSNKRADILLQHYSTSNEWMGDHIPYERGMQIDKVINQTTLVKLRDGELPLYYPANKLKILEDQEEIIIAESPIKDVGQSSARYYEMAWQTGSATLVSVVRPFGSNGDPDRDPYDFVFPGDPPRQYTMSNGKILTISSVEVEDEGMFRKCKITMKTDDEERTVDQWLMKEAFSYDSEANGLFLIKHLMDAHPELLKKDQPIIVSCKTGKDRSAAFAMWTAIYRSIQQNNLKLNDITLSFLNEIANNVEKRTAGGVLMDHVKQTIPRYFPTDQQLQEGLRSAGWFSPGV